MRLGADKVWAFFFFFLFWVACAEKMGGMSVDLRSGVCGCEVG